MTKQKVIHIDGSGGHCRYCIKVIESNGHLGIKDIIHLLYLEVTKSLVYNVIGIDEYIEQYGVPDMQFLFKVGKIKKADLKIKLHCKVLDIGNAFATVVSLNTYVFSSTGLGADTIDMHYAMGNTCSVIGDECFYSYYNENNRYRF
jgi:hypothetical protein